VKKTAVVVVGCVVFVAMRKLTKLSGYVTSLLVTLVSGCIPKRCNHLLDT
jgi:hypothetical protein